MDSHVPEGSEYPAPSHFPSVVREPAHTMLCVIGEFALTPVIIFKLAI